MLDTLPSLILSARLRDVGESSRHVERGARSGDFVRVRPGAYLTAAEWRELSPRDRHLVAMAAVAETSRRKLLFCGESAAALHGIPVLGGWSTRPHIVDDVGHRASALVGVATHVVDLADDEVTTVGDALATSPLRTALDIAATRGFLAGVIALDHILGPAFGISRPTVAAAIEGARPFRGVRRVDSAFAVATGLGETPLESLSLGQCHLLGFPTPRQQVEFVVDGRRYRVTSSSRRRMPSARPTGGTNTARMSSAPSPRRDSGPRRIVKTTCVPSYAASRGGDGITHSAGRCSRSG